jgi:hypothetical protein
MLSVFMLSVICAKCHKKDFTLNAILLSVFMLSEIS